MKTILVTGGGGFIGSNLVAGLLARGTHNVVVCDRFGQGDQWRNLGKHYPSEIITPSELYEWLDSNRSQLEMVYHLGSISSTVEDKINLLLSDNFSASLKIWRWCNAHAVRLVYASSAATYGDGEQGFDDSIDLTNIYSHQSLSAYGWSKQLFDTHVARAVAGNECEIPQWVGFKFFNNYGPNEYHKGDQRSVISKMAEQVIQGAAVRLFRSYNPKYKDGGQKRDVIYVKDSVRVLLWVLDNPQVSGLFNLGSGQANTFNEMANAVFAAMDAKPNIHYIDMPESLVHKYQYFTEAKMDKLRAAGYKEPFTPLTDGVKDYLQNYLLKEDPYL